MVRSAKRLDRLNERVAQIPVTNSALEQAVERFRTTGDLCVHGRLAERVVEWTLRQPRHPPIRQILLEEAVSGCEPVRLAARFVLKVLISAGCDVTSRTFLDEDIPLPEFGSVGLYFLGFPDFIVREPYEDQARRLLARLRKLRAHIPSDDRGWVESFAGLAAGFMRGEGLPPHEPEQETVLAYVELLSLCKNIGAEADPEVLATFDLVASSVGVQRGEGIKKLCALAAEGRML